MSLRTPLNKQFFWNVKDTRSIERGIAGFKVQPSGGGTTSTARVKITSYTFTSNAKMNKIRVRIYGYLSSSGYTLYAYLNINGVDVASGSTTSLNPALMIDYIGNITPNTSYTLEVDGYVTGATGYISPWYIIAGFSLTSTTSTNILSVTLDTANVDSYILKVNGNFQYKMGVRWWIKGNRKTAATASFSSTLANEIQSNAYYGASGDDGENIAVITIRTGDYLGDNGSFTISGNVGASGDLIIITGIYAQVVLRGNLTDSLQNGSGWFLLIKEKGFVSWTQEALSIDGGSYANVINIVTKSGYKQMYASSTGTDVVSTLSFPSFDVPEIICHIGNNEDSSGKVFCAYVNIIVLGV
jgi:hypothetical protein